MLIDQVPAGLAAGKDQLVGHVPVVLAGKKTHRNDAEGGSTRRLGEDGGAAFGAEVTGEVRPRISWPHEAFGCSGDLGCSHWEQHDGGVSAARRLLAVLAGALEHGDRASLDGEGDRAAIAAGREIEFRQVMGAHGRQAGMRLAGPQALLAK